MNINTQHENIPLHDGIDDSRPTDSEVTERLNNRFAEISTRATVCDLRNSMTELIWDSGLRVTSELDLVGLPSILE